LRILFVARPISVHAARWINQVADAGWDLHLFPAFEGPLHPDFRNVTAYSVTRHGMTPNAGVRRRALWPLPAGGYRVQMFARRLPERWGGRAAWLARVIKKLKPDLVHSLEFQQAGYLTLRARKFYEGRFPAWVTSNWGSDIYLYGPLAGHREKIRGILEGCDYYTCECHRDVKLAREYGFRGEALPVLPVAGGFHIEKMREYRQPGPTSARRVIALKGYQHWAGRALVGLHAIERCADVLKAGGYTVAVYSAAEDVQIAAERMAIATGLRLEIMPEGSHEEMLRLQGRTRVSIGLSISDGLSTSALEALVMGAFPVQSNTSCLDEELVRDGETALIVPAEAPEAVAAAIRRAVTDDELVDRAVAVNDRVAASRLDYSIIQPQVVAMYERIAARVRGEKV
jgi:glycosyltransferase involved in cell wall biosynthesis